MPFNTRFWLLGKSGKVVPMLKSQDLVQVLAYMETPLQVGHITDTRSDLKKTSILWPHYLHKYINRQTNFFPPLGNCVIGQIKNFGVGCRNQVRTQVVPLRGRSAGTVWQNRNIKMEYPCISEEENRSFTERISA